VTVTTDLATPARALAIGAHPDDIEFGAGATLAKWAADGCEVSLLICTDGSKGTWDPSADPAELAATRQIEQRAAAAELGATGDVAFLGWIDGELDSGLRQRSQVASVIRRLQPNVVLGHDPWKRYRLHPDHRHAGLLVVEGIVAARDPHFFPEHELAYHRPDTLLLFEPEVINHVEATDGHEAAKLAALEAHRSQFQSTMFVSDDRELDDFRRREHDRLVEHGAVAEMSLGEGFHRIDEL
jgi:LmbE family N-acetylglucosaminyl deacetylase